MLPAVPADRGIESIRNLRKRGLVLLRSFALVSDVTKQLLGLVA